MDRAHVAASYAGADATHVPVRVTIVIEKKIIVVVVTLLLSSLFFQSMWVSRGNLLIILFRFRLVLLLCGAEVENCAGGSATANRKGSQRRVAEGNTVAPIAEGADVPFGPVLTVAVLLRSIVIERSDIIRTPSAPIAQRHTTDGGALHQCWVFVGVGGRSSVRKPQRPAEATSPPAIGIRVAAALPCIDGGGARGVVVNGVDVAVAVVGRHHH